MRLVLCAGCFDLLHVAHVRHLQEARTFGDYLVVGVTMDKYVNKPARPIIPEDERKEMVRALHCVAAVSLCKSSLEALEQWKPNIFVKGADYLQKGLLKEEIDYCKAHGIEIRHTSPNPQSTSTIIERILCASLSPAAAVM